MVSTRIRTATITAIVLGGATTALIIGAGHAAAWPWDDVGQKVEDGAKGLLARMVNAILYALISLMKFVMTFFTAEKTNLDANSFTSMIEWANDYLYSLQSIFLFASVVFIAGKFAIAQWTGGSQHAVTSGISVSVRALATSLGAATIVILLTRASDIFAAWIYDDTGEKVDQVTAEVKKQIGTIDAENFDGSSFLLVIIAIIAVLGCLDLLIQLFLRLFYLAFGTAILPVAAAASGTDGGQATYNQVLRLLIAMIAFKPICAGAFSLAMSYPLTDQSDASDVFIAVLLYIAPILCLPTLLSLVGVGGAVHGRVGGLAGVAAVVGFARVGQRSIGRTGRNVTGAIGRFGGSGGGGGGGGRGPNRPTGTNPTPGGGSRRSIGGGGGGGSFAPANSSGGGSGSPRSSSRNPTAAAATGGPRSKGNSPANHGSPSRHGQPGGDAAASGAGRHSAGEHQPARDRTPNRGRERPANSSDSASPRTQRPTTAPPRRTVGSTRISSGDRRNSARSVARRNLGAHYIGRR